MDVCTTPLFLSILILLQKPTDLNAQILFRQYILHYESAYAHDHLNLINLAAVVQILTQRVVNLHAGCVT